MKKIQRALEIVIVLIAFVTLITIMLPMILRDAKASVYPPPMSR